MLTSGGQVVVSAFNVSATVGASNGQLDNYWVNQYGDFTTAGTGTATAADAVSLATVNGISNANEAVSLTISSLATGQQVGLVARYNGSGLTDMYYGSIVATSANTYTAYIYRIRQWRLDVVIQPELQGTRHDRGRDTGIRAWSAAHCSCP